MRQSLPHGDNKYIIVSLGCQVKKVLKRDDITRLQSCDVIPKGFIDNRTEAERTR